MTFLRSKSFSDYHHDSSDDYRLLSYLSLPNINITYILCKLECSNPVNYKCSTRSMDNILNNNNSNIDTESHLSAVTCNELLISKPQWLIKDKIQQLSHSSTMLLTNKMDGDSLQNIASLCWHEKFSLNRSSSLFTPLSFRSECLISYTEENDVLSFDDGESLDTNKHLEELNAPSAMLTVLVGLLLLLSLRILC